MKRYSDGKRVIAFHIGKNTIGIGYPVSFRKFRDNGFSIKVGALYIRCFKNRRDNRAELNFSRPFWINLFGCNTIHIHN